MLHTKIEGNDQEKTQNQMRPPNYKVCRNYRGNWQQIQENRGGRIETAGHLSVIEDLKLWKRLKNNDSGDDENENDLISTAHSYFEMRISSNKSYPL